MMPSLAPHPSPPRLRALLKEQTAESAQLDKRIAGILRELGHGR